MITAQQLARLPMYAQDEIQRLRRKLREAEADRDAARLATKPEETNTIVDVYADIPIGLPTDTAVRFILERDSEANLRDGIWLDARVSRRPGREDCIELIGRYALRIMPWASNMALISTKRD